MKKLIHHRRSVESERGHCSGSHTCLFWEFLDDIRSGNLRSQAVEGTIISVFETGDSAFPEFSMDTISGERLTFQRYGEVDRYVVGCHVDIEYVDHRWHESDVPGLNEILGETDHLVLRVWIENAHDKN